MASVKKVIAHIPIVGYILRFISSLIFLPKHLTAFRHAFSRDQKQIESLEAVTLRANRQIIELQERIELLEQKHKK